jgi:hypothetical protein
MSHQHVPETMAAERRAEFPKQQNDSGAAGVRFFAYFLSRKQRK